MVAANSSAPMAVTHPCALPSQAKRAASDSASGPSHTATSAGMGMMAGMEPAIMPKRKMASTGSCASCAPLAGVSSQGAAPHAQDVMSSKGNTWRIASDGRASG